MRGEVITNISSFSDRAVIRSPTGYEEIARCGDTFGISFDRPRPMREVDLIREMRGYD